MSDLFGGQYGYWAVSDEETGLPLVTFTTVISLDVTNEANVPDQPTEEGGFFSYNKVATPIAATVSLAMQGDDTTLAEVITTLNRVVADTTLVVVETPNHILSSMTLEGYNYQRRREGGVGWLVVDLRLKEIRQVAAQYVNLPRKQVKNPSDASKTDKGKVQTKSLSKQALDAITGKS